jgi:hypothetical protein
LPALQLVAILHLILFAPLLIAGLLGPGWLLGRALNAPAGIGGAFIGSAAILFNLTLAISAFGLAINAITLGLGLALVCLVLFAVNRRRVVAQSSAPAAGGVAPKHGIFMKLAVGIGCGAIATRAVLDPLSGFDTGFRWDFLARQMFRYESLAFYPAVTASDFFFYPWCDGIAPIISVLYLWSYYCLGEPHGLATVPVVAGQALLLFRLVYKLASQGNDRSNGRNAAAILATSPVALWAVAMGQETGLTAVALIAMFLFIKTQADAEENHWAIWAGISAGVGALAREYGLAYIVFGWAAFAWERSHRRTWLRFTAAAAVVALPWYLRNWMKTGNPLYSHDIAGLFPTNSVHAAYHTMVAELVTWRMLPGAGWLVVMAIIAVAGAPLVLGVAGGLLGLRRFCPWLFAFVGMIGIWIVSIPNTSGGMAYSLRVLSPALALGAVLGGTFVSRWQRHKFAAGCIAVSLAVLATDAAARSLYLPLNPAVEWWSRDAGEWRIFGKSAESWRNHPNWAAIVDAAEGRQIIVSDPGNHAILAARGGHAVPLFSPAVRFLFAGNVDFGTAVDRLRSQNTRFILMAHYNPYNDALTEPHAFFRTLRSATPALRTTLYSVYDLYSSDFIPTTNAPGVRSQPP